MSPARNNPDDASAPDAVAELFDRFTFGSDRRARRQRAQGQQTQGQRKKGQRQQDQQRGHEHEEPWGEHQQEQGEQHERGSAEPPPMAWPQDAPPGSDLPWTTGQDWPPEAGDDWPQAETQEGWPADAAGDEPSPRVSHDDPAPSKGSHDTAASIRPYAWTGGRTKSAHRLELETLVSTSEQCHPARLERVEHHSIAELCRHPRSVAEVGATLGVPLGVAKVLLGDMAELGLVVIHRTVTDNGSAPHLDLMERVLSGLRRL